MPRELFTADLVIAQRCSNNYVNNFHFKVHKRVHTFTYISSEWHANTDVITLLCTHCAEMHTWRRGGKMCIFSPLFATFVVALGLSACLGVTEKKGWTRKDKDGGLNSFPFRKAIMPLLTVWARCDFLWVKRFIWVVCGTFAWGSLYVAGWNPYEPSHCTVRQGF